MMLRIALILSMIIQIGATVIALGLIRRTRFNVSWILISVGFILMAIRRLVDFSSLFWESGLFSKEEIDAWLGVLISLLIFIGVIFIRSIFNLQDRIEIIRRESELKVLSAVIQAEEKTRQAVARELHDGLGPVLSSIKMINSTFDQEKLGTHNKKIVERTDQAVDEAILSLKEISNFLSPHLLTNYGITKAVKTFANQLLSDTSVDFDFFTNLKEQRYAYEIEINVYRIFTELVNNSIKHADPDKIVLEIMEEDRLLRFKYLDNGKGFGKTRYGLTPEDTGMGMSNIRSRVKSLNGSFHMETSPGEGLLVHIVIPLEEKKKEQDTNRILD